MMSGTDGRGDVATKGRSEANGGLSNELFLFMSAVASPGEGKRHGVKLKKEKGSCKSENVEMNE